MTSVASAVPVGARTPWKGLAPYDDSSADAALFFGRDREIEVACANLQASRLTVLFGASGVGKSSLLRAGVIRRLRDEDGVAAALVSSWAEDPVATVAAAAREAVERAVGYELDDPGGSLAERLRAWLEALDGDLLLVLDQVEEYFLYHEGEDGPGSFAAEFPALVTERGLRVHVLLGIREDALGLLDAFRAAVPGVLSNYLRLERLDRDAGRLAVLGPIALWNELAPDDAMSAEPELVEAVLDEVAAGRIEPDAGGLGGVTPSALVERIEAPYLQLVLERLWEAERAEGSPVLRRETLRRLGGAEHIVEQHLERSLVVSTRTSATAQRRCSPTSSRRRARRSRTRSRTSRAMRSSSAGARPRSWGRSSESGSCGRREAAASRSTTTCSQPRSASGGATTRRRRLSNASGGGTAALS